MSNISTNTVYATTASAARQVGGGVAYITLVFFDFLRGLAHAPTREGVRRVVITLVAFTAVLLAATLLALALRLPLELMLAG